VKADVAHGALLPTTALLHDNTPDIRARHCELDGLDIAYFDQAVWVGAPVLRGLPATVAPVSLARPGLPIGVQIIGSHTVTSFLSLSVKRSPRPGG
jgi:Asp-tRNA(Asn)/Glu-tRNA(Gln) amidotransferase A subunit family amidase